jgi:hypothetical protein
MEPVLTVRSTGQMRNRSAGRGRSSTVTSRRLRQPESAALWGQAAFCPWRDANTSVKVGVGHGPDEPESVMVFRRLVVVRPLWFREFRLSKPNWNLSRRPAVQTDRSSARRDHVARCLSSHLSIIECTHRADGEDPPARPARWIMRTCLLLMWSDSNHSEDAVKSFPTTRMRRLWARYRSIEWPRHVGVRSAWHHARTPVCP